MRSAFAHARARAEPGGAIVGPSADSDCRALAARIRDADHFSLRDGSAGKAKRQRLERNHNVGRLGRVLFDLNREFANGGLHQGI